MTEQALLFGANGFIGRVISRLLEHSSGFELVKLYRQGVKQVAHFQDQIFEFESIEALGAFLRKHSSAKFAINAAAQTFKGSSHEEIRLLVESNVSYTSHIAKLCVDVGVERLVHFGTFSTSVDGVNPDPQTFYAASKAASYEVLRYFSLREALKVVVIELYDVYAKDHPHSKVISRLIEALTTGTPMTLSFGEQELAPIHALDVATSAIDATEMPVSEDFSIWSLPGPETFTLKTLATAIAKAIGQERNLKVIDFSEPYRANEIMIVKPRHQIFPLSNPIYVQDGVKISALGQLD